MSISRRAFLGYGAAACLAQLPLTATAQAKSPEPPPDLFSPAVLDMDFWIQPRKVNLYRPATQERVVLKYWEDGVYNLKALEELNHLLRDVQANEATTMDKALIDTIWAAQAFVGRYGFKEPVHILSGYRTEQTNERLREQGIPAARQSLHCQAKAADLRLPGLHAEVLGELLKGFQNGGVGFYLKAQAKTGGWIHADTGRVRQWQG